MVQWVFVIVNVRGSDEPSVLQNHPKRLLVNTLYINYTTSVYIIRLFLSCSEIF